MELEMEVEGRKKKELMLQVTQLRDELKMRDDEDILKQKVRGRKQKKEKQQRVIERRLKKISRRQRKKEKDECTGRDGSTVEQYGLQQSRSGGTTRLCTTDNHAYIISLRLF